MASDGHRCTISTRRCSQSIHFLWRCRIAASNSYSQTRPAIMNTSTCKQSHTLSKIHIVPIVLRLLTHHTWRAVYTGAGIEPPSVLVVQSLATPFRFGPPLPTAAPLRLMHCFFSLQLLRVLLHIAIVLTAHLQIAEHPLQSLREKQLLRILM
jgi:hypothetical protein